jgi:hypothetical protein
MGMISTISGSPKLKVRLARLFIASMLAVHVIFFWNIREFVVRGDPDFTVYFTGASMLRQGLGRELYNSDAQKQIQQQFAAVARTRHAPLPYIHPPYEALIFVPLTFLHYTTAYVVWNAVNAGILIWVCILLRSILISLQRIPLLDCILACLALYPIFATFHQGQDAILLLLALTLSFRALSRSSDFAAGCWLGLGFFKFQFLIPLVIVLAFWRGKRLGFGATVVGSAAAALSVLIVGWNAALGYPAFAWRIVSNPSLGGIPYRFIPNLTGLVNGWPVLENVGWPLRIVATVASILLLVAVASMKKLARDQRLFNLCLACAVIASLVACYNTNTYDLSLLLVPIAVCLDTALRSVDFTGTLKALFIPALPLLISPLWFFLWLWWGRTNLMTICLLGWIYAIWREARNLRQSSLPGKPAYAQQEAARLNPQSVG